MSGALIAVFIGLPLCVIAGAIVFFVYRKTLREAKNYERGLKMVPILIHLPPASEDVDGNGRDKRDLTERGVITGSGDV